MIYDGSNFEEEVNDSLHDNSFCLPIRNFSTSAIKLCICDFQIFLLSGQFYHKRSNFFKICNHLIDFDAVDGGKGIMKSNRFLDHWKIPSFLFHLIFNQVQGAFGMCEPNCANFRISEHFVSHFL